MPRQGCLTAVRYEFICDVIKPLGQSEGSQGTWPPYQDEESGAIIQNYSPPTNDAPSHIVHDVPLFAEAVLEGGIRVTGVGERFTQVYDATDFVKAQFPASADVTRRDRITNIRNKRTGVVAWVEEEIPGRPPTEFNVNGLAPVHFMGKLIEYDALLERAQVQ